MVKVKIRSITEADIPTMVRVERAIAGEEGMAALEHSIHNYIYYGDPDLCLVADVAGKVVGFLICETRPWEFGEPEEVGWIKVVGVDPDHQGKGIGRQLGEALLKALKTKGARKVRTLVPRDSGGLIAYFKALGMAQSDHLVLEANL